MLHLALAQIRPRKGDYAENLRRVGGVLAQVADMDEPPDLVVFPETAMSGYFVEGGVREVAVTAGTLFRDLQAQHAAEKAPPMDVTIGFYEELKNRYYNAALYASLGGSQPGIRHVHRKIFLPTYGVFDEERFVDAGHAVQAFDTAWGRAAMVICEDAWHSIVPTLAALRGAQVLIVPSASPARGVAPAARRGAHQEDCDDEPRAGSVHLWERLLVRIAEEHGLYVALSQLVGFEGGKGFQGSSFVIGPSGHVMTRGPSFDEALVTASLDMDDLTRARAALPLLADLEAKLPNLLSQARSGDAVPEFGDAGGTGTKTKPAGAASLPVVTTTTPLDPLAIDPELVARWLTEFLKDEVVRRRGFERGIVALSGGVDSSVTAFLAARALGRENVIGLRLPYRTSSAESLEHGELVVQKLGIELRTVDISKPVDGYFSALGEKGDPRRRGNVMARTRMVALFDLSAGLGALPLGTGNKTERLLGYFTWHADDSPPVNPLGDLFKTQVWELARYLGVPDEIVSKPATADLVQGQTDEGDLGISYAKADFILHDLLEGWRTERIVERGFTEEEVDVVRGRLSSTHWKRRLPTVAMVSRTAIGEYYLRPVDY